MKRVLITVYCLFCIVLSAPLFVHAVGASPVEDDSKSRINTHSSANIEASVLKELNLKSSDQIVKIYNLPIIFAFYKYSTIEEIMNSQYANVVYYRFWANGELMNYTPESGQRPAENAFRNDFALQVYFENKIIKEISPDIVVYNVYYLSGETNRQGTALYYETNWGDYVFYDYYTGCYLMPSTVFVDYIRYLKLERRAAFAGGKNGGTFTYDLTLYDITSDTFDPSVLVGTVNTGNQPVDSDPGKPDNTPWIIAASGAAVAVVAAAAVLILRKRKASKT